MLFFFLLLRFDYFTWISSCDYSGCDVMDDKIYSITEV